MLRTARAAIACALLSLALTGCLPRQAAIPDQSIPHRVAVETTVQVWVRRPDGQLVTETVRLLAGWWIAAPAVVDPPTHP